MGRSPRARTRPAAAVCALLALLVAFAQVHSVAHFALVRHTVCPLDGELAHGDHGHGTAPSALAVELPSESEDAAFDAHEEEGHAEHCLAVQLHEQRSLHPPIGRAPYVAPAAASGLASVTARDAAGTLSVLAFAPKQSPPAAS